MINLVPSKKYLKDMSITLGDRLDYFSYGLSISKIRDTDVCLSFSDELFEFVNDRYDWDKLHLGASTEGITEVLEFGSAAHMTYKTNYYKVFESISDWPKFDNIPEHDISLPEKFVTWQFDAGQSYRQIDPERREKIKKHYEDRGFEIITIGGQAEIEGLRKDISLTTYVMSKASYHVGADSGFPHLAKLVLPMNKVHVYVNSYKVSYQANILEHAGCKINYCEGFNYATSAF